MTLIGPDHQLLGNWINLQMETLFVVVLSDFTNVLFSEATTLKGLALQQLTHKHKSICKSKSLTVTERDPIESNKIHFYMSKLCKTQ